MSENRKYLIYGNVLTGERYKTRRHILILEDDEEYDYFLRQALQKFGVKSDHLIIVHAYGNTIIVESGEGLHSTVEKGIEVDDELAQLLQELHELNAKVSSVVQQIQDWIKGLSYEV